MSEAVRRGDLDSVLALFPADTETLLVCRGPLHVREVTPAQRSLADTLRALAVGPLPAAQDGAFMRGLAERPLRLIAEASRRFELQAIPGVSAYEGCHVLVFEDDLGALAQGFLRAPGFSGSERRQIAGHEALVATHAQGRQTLTVHVVMAAANVVVVATDRGMLEGVLRRMRTPTEREALPRFLPEWEHVDRTSSVWAVRHYDPATAGRDPSSPLAWVAGQRGGIQPWPAHNPAAVGVSMHLEADGDVACIRHTYRGADADPETGAEPDMGSDDDANERHIGQVREIWSRALARPPVSPVRSVAPGVIEARCGWAAGDESYLRLVMSLSTLLGHGIFP